MYAFVFVCILIILIVVIMIVIIVVDRTWLIGIVSRIIMVGMVSQYCTAAEPLLHETPSPGIVLSQLVAAFLSRRILCFLKKKDKKSQPSTHET